MIDGSDAARSVWMDPAAKALILRQRPEKRWISKSSWGFHVPCHRLLSSQAHTSRHGPCRPPSRRPAALVPPAFPPDLLCSAGPSRLNSKRSDDDEAGANLTRGGRWRDAPGDCPGSAGERRSSLVPGRPTWRPTALWMARRGCPGHGEADRASVHERVWLADETLGRCPPGFVR